MVVFRKQARIQLSAEQALEKARSWCAYQERSQDETRKKLKSFGLAPNLAEELVATLISENFINEQRFANAYVSGKFRIKRWGRNKIKAELRRHKISDQIIKNSLEAIDEKEYENTLMVLIEKKMNLLKKETEVKRYYGILNYMVSRGFESDLTIEIINKKNKEL